MRGTPAASISRISFVRLPLAILVLGFVAACSRGGDARPGRASDGDSTNRVARADGACLSYRDTVTLRGIVSRETYPGPPNFADTANGDEPETGLYLQLRNGICTRDGTDETEAALDSVVHVQLVLDSAQLLSLQTNVGQEASVRGTMFSSHTGHHHAPLLLSVVP